jgi:hypothetical protein
MESTPMFPSMVGLPKREKGRVARALDLLQEMKAVVAEKGPLVPPKFAGKILAVSESRVHQLMDAGKLERVEFAEHVFVTESSLIAHAKSERRNGRPPKLPETAKDCWRVASEFAGGR